MTSWHNRAIVALRQHSASWLFGLLLLFGTVAVTATYTRLSETDDELFHIACGMEWWNTGQYTMQPLHPPLARVMDAAFLKLAQVLSEDGKPWLGLPARDVYMHKMVLTRLGSLPFYLLSCILVFIWSRNLFGQSAALWSLAIYVTLSSVTAHAALATTDMGYTAMLLWALMAGAAWLKSPKRTQSLLLGTSLGLAIGTKYSVLAHWPAAMSFMAAALIYDNYRQKKPLLPINKTHIVHGFMYVIPMMVVMLAIVFRFSFTALFNGIRDAQHLSNVGFGVWLYGPLKNHGVWYFFPVVFFFKTPLSLFATSAVGNAEIVQRIRNSKNIECHNTEPLFPILAALAIMLFSMTSNINLGVRHVMPLYPLLAIGAGYGLHRLWQAGSTKRMLAAILMLMQCAGFMSAWPEHISYFNSLAGLHPEEITLDSDFDWGQEMITLDEALQSKNVATAYLCARKDTYWNAHILVHAQILNCPKTPVTGWIAVARAFRLLTPNNFTWLNDYEAVQKVGDTMDLYYIPEK